MEKEEILQELKEIKKLLQIIVSNQEQKCIFCGETGTLELEVGKYICENCAQIQGELSEH